MFLLREAQRVQPRTVGIHNSIGGLRRRQPILISELSSPGSEPKPGPELLLPSGPAQTVRFFEGMDPRQKLPDDSIVVIGQSIRRRFERNWNHLERRGLPTFFDISRTICGQTHMVCLLKFGPHRVKQLCANSVFILYPKRTGAVLGPLDLQA